MSWERNLQAGERALVRGIYHEAENFLLLAREGAAQYGRADSAWADVHRALAKVYIATGKPKQAEEMAQEALASDESYWGPECDQAAEDAFLLGEAFRLQWDFERARGWFERALNYREQRYGTTHDTTLEVLARLVIVYLQSATAFGIESIHARAYQAFQATHPSGMWATYLKLHELAKDYVDQGKNKELHELLQREANLLRKQVGVSHKEVASVLAIEQEVLKNTDRKLAAWSVGTRVQQVERANDLSLFASTERMYKLPAPQAAEAIEQLLMVPIVGFDAPNAVRRARWRIASRQSPQEPLVAQLVYDDGSGSGQTAELKLTLHIQSRGPMCGATYQWQLFNSSNMALAQTIIAYVVKDIDDNLAVMKPGFDLPVGFANPLGAQPVVAWPTPQQFNESVQNPRVSFVDSDLQASEAEVNALGLPKPYSGAFATVYKLKSDEHERAVKCFTTRVPDQQQRYAAISQTLSNLRSPYFVQFEYQAEGIAVSGQRYPILKMEWAHGDGLIPYIEANLSNRDKMQDLAVRFLKMMLSLHQAGIAHGDLQHGNLIVYDGDLRLVDYDAMFVPALSGWKSNELGHRNYQHPQRTADHFNERIDNFSAWVIYTSLICLSRAPQLWNLLGAGEERLLFKQDDFKAPDTSNAFRLLSSESDTDIRAAIRFFSEIVRQKPEEIPSVAEVFGASR